MTEFIPVSPVEGWIHDLTSILKADAHEAETGTDFSINEGMRHGLAQIQARLTTWLRHQENMKVLNRSGGSTNIAAISRNSFLFCLGTGTLGGGLERDNPLTSLPHMGTGLKNPGYPHTNFSGGFDRSIENIEAHRHENFRETEVPELLIPNKTYLRLFCGSWFGWKSEELPVPNTETDPVA